MGKPRYTDLERYKHGYTPANATDVSKTFERVRKQIKEQQDRDRENDAERLRKTIALKARKA